MKTGIILSICLAVSLLTLTGCPGANASTIALGIWLLDHEVAIGFVGFELLPGGDVDELASPPLGAAYVFPGELTWTQNGNEIVIRQETAQNVFYYSGAVESPTYITGMWSKESDPSVGGPFQMSKSPQL